jgi:hypothetical protein
MIYLYRSAPNVYQNSALGSYLKQQVYGGASIVDLFRWPLVFGALAFLAQLPLSIPKDIRRRKQIKYGRRLFGQQTLYRAGRTRNEQPGAQRPWGKGGTCYAAGTTSYKSGWCVSSGADWKLIESALAERIERGFSSSDHRQA